MVRSKMKLVEVTETMYASGSKKLKFSAEYDTSIPEDQRFQKATPSAQAEYYIDNPEALAQFELGKSYYVDFTPVETAVSAAS